MVEGATPAQVWSLDVGLQAVPDWPPAIASVRRRLTLECGGQVCEKCLGSDAISYPYDVEEPVQRRRTRTASTNPYNVDKPVRHDHVHVRLDLDV